MILSLILHFALLSKPRQKTATNVWEVVCGSALSKHALLKGVSEAVNPALISGDEKASLDAEEMASINAAVVARLAGQRNIFLCVSDTLTKINTVLRERPSF